MPLPKTFKKRGSYYTAFRFPSQRTENRIVIPQPYKRPVRFQARSLIRQDLIQKDKWWFILHRRGVARKDIGENPLESRAVPHDLVRGTLPERIIYKSLVESFHLIPGFDFEFQSSLQGGRIDTGGIVADFIFPYLKMVINPTGPTHDEFIRIRKDDEQTMALAEMGYQVFFIEEEKVYDEYFLDNWLRRLLGWMHMGGSDSRNEFDDVESNPSFINDRIITTLMELSDYIHTGVY